MQKIEKNKETTRKFFDYFVNQNYDEMLTLFTDDVTHSMPGKFPFAGQMNGLEEYITRIKNRFQGNVIEAKFDILHLTAEDNRVSAEAVGLFKFKNGIVYENTYHFLYLFNDEGMIYRMIEYMDTYTFTKLFSK
ncbi:hypothetical protein AMD27_05685 [Acinetobacter sp. TGL-Y2]|uniref:nuclear transport factor 2 family protein n=1 Tax=Acinetobacter sp. TGL-Y2 TaxID=1407071 RepID=UPI0007A65C4F|nr:nuclear transport factor 2 family protein [Acinetobacter sp. TGL-Y2]AMW78424.1 hypothetical protein AMD27_05685 [Acinetobacter sp. TGL-Y2]